MNLNDCHVLGRGAEHGANGRAQRDRISWAQGAGSTCDMSHLTEHTTGRRRGEVKPIKSRLLTSRMAPAMLEPATSISASLNLQREGGKGIQEVDVTS